MKKLNKEHKDKIRKSLKGRHVSPKTEFKKGHKISEITKKRMSFTKKGRKSKPFTKEHKNNISKSLIGKTKGRRMKEETKRKLSIIKKGIRVNPKTEFKKGHTPWNKNKKVKEISGEKHWNWLGGKSFEPYSIDWTKTLRRSIRERDKFTCQICKKIEEDRLHSVHHIDYNKKNNNPENLITICVKCHVKTNFNRDRWKEYFGVFEKRKTMEREVKQNE